MIIQAITGSKSTTSQNQPTASSKVIQPLTSKPTNNSLSQNKPTQSIPTVQAPQKGFSIGDTIKNIGDTIGSIINPPAFKPIQLANNIKLNLATPTIAPPQQQNGASKPSMPVLTDFSPTQKTLTTSQMIKIQPPRIPTVTNSPIDKLALTLINGSHQMLTDLKNATVETGQAWANLPQQLMESSHGKIKTVNADLSPSAQRGIDIIAGLKAVPEAGAVAGNESYIAKQALGKITQDVTQTQGIAKNFFFSSKDLQGLGDKVTNEVLDSLNLSANELKTIRKASIGGEGVSVQVPSSTIVQIADKPWFAKFKSFLGQAPSSASTIIESKPNITSIAGLLSSGEHTPQEIIDTVLQNDMAKTAEGQKMMQAAVQAQKTGQNIVISKTSPAIDTFEKNLQDYRSFGGYSVGTDTENAALRDIAKAANTPEIQAYTQKQVENAVTAGELKPNSDGTITLYRGGNPSTVNGLTSATYDKSVAQTFADNAGGVLHQFKVKPEDIQAFIGKAEKEVLVKNDILDNKQLGLFDTIQSIKASTTPDDKILNPVIDEISGILKEYESSQSLKRTGNQISQGNGSKAQSTSGKDIENSQRPNSPSSNQSQGAASIGGNQGSRPEPTTAETIRSGNTGSNASQPASTSTNPIGNGQALKVSKIAKEIDAKAVEDKLTEGFSQLAGYNSTTIKEQGKMASDLVNNNFLKARDIINGKKPLPEGLKGVSLIKAMETYIVQNKDGQLALELAKSPLVSGTSQAAQELRLAAERNPYSPVEIIKKLEDDRRAVLLKSKGETPDAVIRKTTRQIKERVRVPDKYDWNSFVDSIQC